MPKENNDIKEGNVIVTYKFNNPDAANGWLLEKNQKVTLAYSPFTSTPNQDSTIPNNLFNYKYIQAKIYEIIDEQLISIEEHTFNKRNSLYISFEVTEEDGKFIIASKDKGRLDIYWD
ncbi:hypothetical protein [Natranaerovirga pectinivora]|uniref:hypothetical protein n=1 Tax=Natranaerovirga pectinivora TaxID=682400 RepID=UPI001404824F|nr:hypothetical protein [Natranaerovirga pectinivora]